MGSITAKQGSRVARKIVLSQLTFSFTGLASRLDYPPGGGQPDGNINDDRLVQPAL
tara:strand:- start:25 stop:192 length:168 start_codon:yes stop_codon:yes gene_type:complete